jgi:transcriptional regulator with XRE-family HTH domain
LPNPVDVYVGKRMRQRREMQGLPQKELARKLGISFQQVQKYESGANRISASKLWQLCDVLDVEPGYFFDGLDTSRRRATGEDYEADPRSARQVLDLNQSFQKISSPRVRRQVVQLVKSLGS